MSRVNVIHQYKSWDGWITGTKFQCLIDNDVIYSRSLKALDKKLAKKGIEMPKLHEPVPTSYKGQFTIYDQWETNE